MVKTLKTVVAVVIVVDIVVVAVNAAGSLRCENILVERPREAAKLAKQPSNLLSCERVVCTLSCLVS